MLIDFKTLLYDMLYKNFKIAHLDTKVKFDVTDTDGIGVKFKDAVKKEYTAKFLDDSEYIIGFMEPLAAQDKDEEEPEDEEPGEEEVDDDAEYDGAEDGPEGDETEDGEGDEDEDGGKKVEESEVEKLTSSMLKSEAETTATGEELKAKIRKSIAYTFGI